MSDSLDDELMPFSIDYRSIVGYLQLQLRSNNKTADSAPGLATWEVTSSARKVVPCVRWPATYITAYSL